ncbi:MAG: hypothetical protein KJ737_14080 [Proteobacteria bacterium]|nr:hypothetical protein [Pseudomonadota bacterium]
MIKKMVYAGISGFFLMASFYGGEVLSAPVKKIVMLPFNIFAETDLSYLQEGINRMLNARLEPLRQTILFDILEKEGDSAAKLTDFSNAVEQGRHVSADFVLWGSITVLGEKVSTDIQLINVNTGKTELPFSRLGQEKGDILGHVDACAEMLIAYFSGNEPHSQVQPAQQEPDKPLTILKSQTFDFAIAGISAGDVTGNGRNEVVLTGKDSVYIYENVIKDPVRIFEYKEKNSSKILGVDVADINENGKAEIYVTAIYENSGNLKSFVLEWQDGTCKKITDREKWFLRVIDNGKEKKMLVGQKRGSQSMVFKSGIYELGWKNNSLFALRQLDAPDRATVFGFTTGDVFNTGRNNAVAVNRDGHVVVYQEDGKEAWVSPVVYGGSENFVEYDTSPVADDNFHYYLPQRMFISDITQNGLNELVLVCNHEMTDRIFARMRHYDSGFIECLAWDAIGFKHLLKTQDISGYISDYQVGDLNRNGHPDLFFSVVSGSGKFFGEKTSYLVFWEYGT